jgi:hypothetical protein
MNKWNITYSNVPGLAIWLDGQDPLGTGSAPAIGTVVPTWFDKSGNGYNGTASASPTYSNGIVFNGAPYYTIPYAGTHSRETTFIVLNLVSFSGANFITGNTGGSRSFSQPTPNPLYMTSTNNSGFLGVTTTYQLNTNVLLEYSLSTDSTLTAIIYQNGTALGAGTYTTAIQAEQFIMIGGYAFSSVASGNLTGTIKEVLVYSNVLTTTQRQLIEGYLATKWSMQASLPADHPYLSTPVTGYNPRNQYSTPSNVGYLAVPQDAVSMNPATSVLSYDGTSWSVE